VTEQVNPEAPVAPVDPFAARLQEQFGERLGDVRLDADHPTIVVGRDDLVAVLSFLRQDRELAFDRLVDVCGVDNLGLGPEPRFVVVYHVYSMRDNRYVRVRVPLDEDDPVVPSIVGLWPAANWMEREAYDMYGIRFAGHPDLKRILTPDDWEVYPLRKDFAPPPEPIEFSFNPDQWQKAVQRGDA
jgi:NADH-quinone oxidoreductase subunit C